MKKRQKGSGEREQEMKYGIEMKANDRGFTLGN